MLVRSQDGPGGVTHFTWTRLTNVGIDQTTPEHEHVCTLVGEGRDGAARMAVDHLGVVLAISRGVHCEFQVLEAVVLRQEGHEGGEGVGRGRGVVEYLGQVGLAAMGARDVFRYGDGQWLGLAVGHGHVDVPAVVVVVVQVGDGGGGRRGGGRGRCSYRERLGTRLPGNHDAAPELFVDAAGVLPALLVEAFTGTELQLLRQRDGGRHEVQRTWCLEQRVGRGRREISDPT